MIEVIGNSREYKKINNNKKNEAHITKNIEMDFQIRGSFFIFCHQFCKAIIGSKNQVGMEAHIMQGGRTHQSICHLMHK